MPGTHQVVARPRGARSRRPSWRRGAPTGVTPGAASSPRGARRTRSSWRAVNSRSSCRAPSATARWVQRPLEGRAASASRPRRAKSDHGVGLEPDPVHPGVDLHVHDRPARPTAPAASSDGRRAPAGLYSVGVSRCSTAAAAASAGGSESTRIGRGDPGLAQRDPLLDDGDGESGRAGLQRRRRHQRGPVPVAVGLDHRAQRGRPADLGEQRDVVPRRRRGRSRPGSGRSRASAIDAGAPAGR